MFAMTPQEVSLPTTLELPPLPARHTDFIKYVAAHPKTPMQSLLEPYKAYDNKLREVFAQHPDHPAIKEPNVVSIFITPSEGIVSDLKIRARNVSEESVEEQQRFIMPLAEHDRKPDGSPAVVSSLGTFQKNFAIFSESALSDLDWSNVVAAGSAVVTSLLPVPKAASESKRALREYYHEKLAPASDVDLFLYGLTEDQATEKIKQIEQRIRDSILTETTTIRTKNAITIASQYPTRHIQIVLRIYKSISEILTGFDVDCSCAAYDGSQVYASPRALGAFMTQINTVDLSRRSPSYENRLSKYSHRGFEVSWPLLERQRVDPTIFERSFGRTMGLARLLVLEKLPSSSARDAYTDQRREERGRPAVNRWVRQEKKLNGNVKDQHDDEVPDWADEDELSNYHTFTVPYGPKFNAKKIERLLYAKDLLLNAEWNRPKDRETTLHRHPAFFGNVDDVLRDCCGYCPEPTGPEDEELAAAENKIYVRGDITFLKDDPGRQTIGSFNPITNDDWTEMAYVGNTARLCQAIVDHDLEHVQDWLKQDGSDPNRRDYTGRTPLQLAVACSSLEIVQALIDNGARLVARLADGKTALHLAALQGDTDKVKALLRKSEENEEEEAKKESIGRKTKSGSNPVEEGQDDEDSTQKTSSIVPQADQDHEEDNVDMMDEDGDSNVDATTEESFVNIKNMQIQDDNVPDDASTDEPDIYDINVTSWDVPVSPLHLAIANGHIETVKVLVQDFGADILLPVKLVEGHTKRPRAAILTLALALMLPADKAEEMVRTLVSLGASLSQADMEQVTSLHYFASGHPELLAALIGADKAAAARVLDHLAVFGHTWNPSVSTPLLSAVRGRDQASIEQLLRAGSIPTIDYPKYVRSLKLRFSQRDVAQDEGNFDQNVQQPVWVAVEQEMPAIASQLLAAGANVNTLSPGCLSTIQPNMFYRSGRNMKSLLDVVQDKIKQLKEYKEGPSYFQPPVPMKADEEYLQGLVPGTYRFWSTTKQIQSSREEVKRQQEAYERNIKGHRSEQQIDLKQSAVHSLLREFEKLESDMFERGAKTLKELYPDVKPVQAHAYQPIQHYQTHPRMSDPSLYMRVPGLTDEGKAGYIRLFEAAWDGDLEVIKELTLGVWGNNHSPLMIAVSDTANFSPFSIAVCRKHLGVAKAILEIAQAQYAPPETPRSKYTLQHEGSDDEESADDKDAGLHIYSEIVDDKFTVDNIGEVHAEVKSTVAPHDLMTWQCPVPRILDQQEFSTVYQPQGWLKARWMPELSKPSNLLQMAVYLDDSELLAFYLEMGQKYTALQKGDGPGSRIFALGEADFSYVLQSGRVHLTATIVKETGAGIPLEHLVKESGVEDKEKPEYYQGLSVHGKKRTDWAQAGRGDHPIGRNTAHPPLLESAFKGSLESVEWLRSDNARRCYYDFADAHKNDKRLKTLSEAKGGMHAAINRWLDTRSKITAHCVVMGRTTPESLELLRYIIDASPAMLESKSVNGQTPLQLAFALHRVEMIEILIGAGADQTCRDHMGRNIVHSAMVSRDGEDESDPSNLGRVLSLIDERLLASLFTERCHDDPGALTPLAYWLSRIYRSGSTADSNDHVIEYFQEAIRFSKGNELDLINGAGDTPLHTAVKCGMDRLLVAMLEHRPELLYRESATGRTPYEMAEDAHLSKVFANPPPVPGATSRYYQNDRIHHQALVDRPLHDFKPEGEEKDTPSAEDRVWAICKEFGGRGGNSKKRKLVSLIEANEVAKRLAMKHAVTQRPGRNQDTEGHEQAGQSEAIKDASDEVEAWFDQSRN